MRLEHLRRTTENIAARMMGGRLGIDRTLAARETDAVKVFVRS